VNSPSSPGISLVLRELPPTLTVLSNALGEKERVTLMEICIIAFATQTWPMMYKMILRTREPINLTPNLARPSAININIQHQYQLS
jgi:hypothetical protein